MSETEAPTFTQDGARIIFAQYRDGRWQLATANADGSNVQMLSMSTNVNRHAQPRWAPSGA